MGIKVGAGSVRAAVWAVALWSCVPSGPEMSAAEIQAACASRKDSGSDCDGDHVTPAQGDCDDGDPTIYPGAPELCDLKDHDCNRIVDDFCDDDKDGYAVLKNGVVPGGDCDDRDPLINPGAYEYVGNLIDDDCDGKVDNPYPACVVNPSDPEPLRYAASLGLCKPWVVSADLNADADPAGRAIKRKFGTYQPHQGEDFVVFATGVAADESEPGFVAPQPGTGFHNNDPNPFQQDSANLCYSGPDEFNVHDYIELRLMLRVPTNGKALAFDFKFLSAEYPEYVGTPYNDKFLALLDSKSFRGNVSVDQQQNPITVNSSVFTVCDTANICGGTLLNTCAKAADELFGTGYELKDTNGDRMGGATAWITSVAPLSPGEDAILRFVLFDEGDHLLDSAVILDDFRWRLNPAHLIDSL